MYLENRMGTKEVGTKEKNSPNEPEIITTVPASPEPKRGVIVCHASYHILRWVDSVHERPQPEESPRYQKLWEFGCVR
jgi:hypothetical protein